MSDYNPQHIADLLQQRLASSDATKLALRDAHAKNKALSDENTILKQQLQLRAIQQAGSGGRSTAGSLPPAPPHTDTVSSSSPEKQEAATQHPSVSLQPQVPQDGYEPSETTGGESFDVLAGPSDGITATTPPPLQPISNSGRASAPVPMNTEPAVPPAESVWMTSIIRENANTTPAPTAAAALQPGIVNRICDDVQFQREQLQQNTTDVHTLQSACQQLATRVSGLEETVASLKEQVEQAKQQRQDVQQLKTTLRQLERALRSEGAPSAGAAGSGGSSSGRAASAGPAVFYSPHGGHIASLKLMEIIGPAGTAVPAPSAKWSCKYCTFENPSSSTQCAQCNQQHH